MAKKLTKAKYSVGGSAGSKPTEKKNTAAKPVMKAGGAAKKPLKKYQGQSLNSEVGTNSITTPKFSLKLPNYSFSKTKTQSATGDQPAYTSDIDPRNTGRSYKTTINKERTGSIRNGISDRFVTKTREITPEGKLIKTKTVQNSAPAFISSPQNRTKIKVRDVSSAKADRERAKYQRYENIQNNFKLGEKLEEYQRIEDARNNKKKGGTIKKTVTKKKK